MEMHTYTINIKTTVTWHHDYYGCQVGGDRRIEKYYPFFSISVFFHGH